MLRSSKQIHMDDLNVEEVNWSSVRERILAINPSLAEAIDDMSPGPKHTFFIARYPYGAKIVDKGKFALPLKSKELVSLSDPSLNDDVRKKIAGPAIPLCLTLTNSNEVFAETSQERVVPLNFFIPGDLFGVFEVLNQITQISSEPLWSVTAGAKTVFLLPRANDLIGHNRIRKELNITAPAPKNLGDQFDFFKEIAIKSNSEWENEILIFTNEWFVNTDTEKNTVKFYKFLLVLCWKQLQLFRDTIDSSLRWASFSEEMGSRNIKPRPYLIDVVKHLISIANGATVALRPATNNIALPVELIQRIYVEIYGLKNYFPTIMQPAKFTKADQPVYFSLSYPTILEGSPFLRNPPSIMDDARELMRLIKIFTQAVMKYHSFSQDDSIVSTQYDFFHTDVDSYSEINSSSLIITQDSRFLAFSDKFSQRVPCDNAPFFRGCVRISRN
ncbi:MAG TPA: hypothetical protein VHE99_01110 [Gammaproteobacteria bacterium]|nr:hypothetical protein [Gammaproteobacteria bacterium]